MPVCACAARMSGACRRCGAACTAARALPAETEDGMRACMRGTSQGHERDKAQRLRCGSADVGGTVHAVLACLQVVEALHETGHSVEAAVEWLFAATC